MMMMARLRRGGDVDVLQPQRDGAHVELLRVYDMRRRLAQAMRAREEADSAERMIDIVAARQLRHDAMPPLR